MKAYLYVLIGWLCIYRMNNCRDLSCTPKGGENIVPITSSNKKDFSNLVRIWEQNSSSKNKGFNHNFVAYILTGNAFSACALFYLGLCMVGKVRNQMGLPLLVPLMLIFAKK